MAFDPNSPKVGSVFPESGSAPTPHIVNSSFIARAMPGAALVCFYGTDSHGERDDYLSTIKRAMENRIAKPVQECWEHRRAYFFKPYSSLLDALIGTISGISLTSLLVSGVFALMGMISNPYLLITFICLPAVVELVMGLISLSQGLYHQMKAWYNRDQAEHNRAREYFLDATTRIALVIPLAAICIISLPFEVARFLTRTIATLIKAMSGRDLSVSATEATPPRPAARERPPAEGAAPRPRGGQGGFFSGSGNALGEGRANDAVQTVRIATDAPHHDHARGYSFPGNGYALGGA